MLCKHAITSSVATWAICLTVPAMIPTIGYAQTNSNSQYLVYLTSNDPQIIQQARTLAPDAFTGALDSGVRVLQMGRYSNLNLAQRRADELKFAGLPVDVARVSVRASVTTAIGGIDPLPGNLNTPPGNTLPPAPSPTREVAPLPGVPGSSEFRTPEQSSIEINRPPTEIPITTATSPGATAVIPIEMTANPVITDPAIIQEKQSFSKRNRYFVIIPTTSDEVLTKVRNLAPSARFAATERGSFIEVQAYPERSSAEVMNKTLRQQGFDSRVVYF